MGKKKTIKVEMTTTENDKIETLEQEVPETPQAVSQSPVEAPPEEKKKERTWAELLADPAEQKNARFLATSIQGSLRNWFTLERYMKKIKDDRQTAISRLFALKEFGYCLIKQERGEFKFKISFNEIDEIQLINDDLEALEIKKKGLIARRENLHERYKQRQEMLDKAEEAKQKKKTKSSKKKQKEVKA